VRAHALLPKVLGPVELRRKTELAEAMRTKQDEASGRGVGRTVS
jgi:hypothetical protein